MEWPSEQNLPSKFKMTEISLRKLKDYVFEKGLCPNNKLSSPNFPCYDKMDKPIAY